MSGEGAAAGAAKGIGSSGAAKAVGAKIASGFGGAAGGIGQAAGAAGSVAKGAAAATGWFGAKSVFEAGQDKGFWLFLGGLFFYFLKVVGVPVTLLVVLATFLLVLSGLVLFEGKKGGWITLIIFYIWGIIFGFKGLYPPDPNFLMYIGSIIFVILLAYGIFTKGKGFGDEAIGFLPVIIFILDIGLFSKVLGSFVTVTSLLTTMILYMPWFAFLGLFNTKKSNLLINISKFVGIFYLVSLVSVGLIPEFGFSSEEIFNPEEYLSAEQDVRSEFGGGPNPAWLQLVCTFGMFTNIASIESYNVEDCVAEKKLDYELDFICREEYGEDRDVNLDSYDDCIKREEERKKEQVNSARGSVDSGIVEVTSAEFIIDLATFPSGVSFRSDQIDIMSEKIKYPLRLDYENPNDNGLIIDISCNFTKQGKDGESFLGLIYPGGEVLVTEVITKTSGSISKLCQIPDEKILNGTYTLSYSAELKNLETKSYLDRLFVFEYDENDELIMEAKREYVSGSSAYSSSADEFARINFAFGEPESNPIISASDNILLSSSIENVGSGKITNIHSYEIGVEPDLYVDGNDNCIYGDGNYVYLPDMMRKGETIPIDFCFLSMSSELIDDLGALDFELRTYNAILIYDYLIVKEKKITVDLINLNS